MQGVLELTSDSAREKLVLPGQFFSSIPFLSLRCEAHPGYICFKVLGVYLSIKINSYWQYH